MIDTSEPTGPPVPSGSPAPPAPPVDEVGPTPEGPGAPHPPRKLRALLIGTVIAAALAVFLFVGLGRSSGNNSGSGSTGTVAGVGSSAPNFTLPSLTGGAPVVLDALGKDRHHPVVLNFFASWCIPCRQETPLLARTAAAQQAKGSAVQFVGVDVADTKADALAFVAQSGLAYPIGADDHVEVAAGLYALDAEPNTFFIDASGKVIGRKIGALDQAELDSWLHKLAGPST